VYRPRPRRSLGSSMRGSGCPIAVEVHATGLSGRFIVDPFMGRPRQAADEVSDIQAKHLPQAAVMAHRHGDQALLAAQRRCYTRSI
jgi:hypothetical protein